jgi:outer membrane protein assembly factor BamA
MRVLLQGLIWATFLLWPFSAAAQPAPAVAGPEADYPTREDAIQAARKDKAARLEPEETSKLEHALNTVEEKRILQRLTYGIGGLHLRLGGLVTGSGFALGPEFTRDDLAGGKVHLRLTTQFSTRWFQLYEAEVLLPRLAENNAFVALRATHFNFPQLQYYGSGPDSEKTGRSDYRLESTNFGFSTGLNPTRRVQLGVLGTFREMNVGPGTDRRFINTEQQFTPSETPGLSDQTDFLVGGVFAEYDGRDRLGGARKGTFLRSEFLYNKDVDLKRHTFRRLNLELQQYLPFFNERRVLAFRARSELSWKNPGQVIPFYLQSILGGSNDLRGFRPWRFYGDNLVLFNAEYRYEVFAGMDMAIFGDAGKVFDRKSQWNVHDLEGAYGVGLRFNARNNVFLRIDAGFSHEGFQVWFKFNDVFAPLLR